MSHLEINNLTVRFGGLVAVNDLSFKVESGSIHGLIGPNGAGKSTVFNCVSRFHRPEAGEIWFEGINLLRLDGHQIVSRGIARTFQNVELFKLQTVLENLMVGMHSRTHSGVFSGALRLPVTKREERDGVSACMETLEFLGIADYALRPVAGLPYGVQKLVELGRALVTKPKMLLLDEPAAGMNHSETDVLSDLIRKTRDRFGMTILLVEHDMTMVMQLCEMITVMNFGKKIASGPPAEIQRDPQVIQAYLGEEATGHASA